MSDVLHLQSRAYPLQHRASGDHWAPVLVPGRGTFTPVPGTLRSMAYNVDATIDGDLTQIVTSAVDLPGTAIVACRLRVLPGGAVILTYALRHDADLCRMDAQALAAFDAEINRRLREADSTVIAEVFRAAVASGLLELPSSGRDGDDGAIGLDTRAVRYNCHFVIADPPWLPDPRMPEVVVRPGCRMLLPFTYAWAGEPDAPIEQTLHLLEAADIAMAQFSLVMGATIAGRWILTELGRGGSGHVEGDDFRRFLDRLWADYYLLDAYRVESAQDHRATYLAARQAMGLDGARDRAEQMLHHVAASLLAESSSRSEQLDRRLNRVAAALTVVAGGGFLIEVVSFLVPEASWPVRAAIVAAVLAAAVGALVAAAVPRRRAARARAQSRPAAPAVAPRPRLPEQLDTATP